MAPAKLKNLYLGQSNGEHCFAAAGISLLEGRESMVGEALLELEQVAQVTAAQQQLTDCQ
jgi:hypothetical protein